MVTCPRCQQPVDENVRTTCPLCFTPLPQKAAAPPEPGSNLASPSSLDGAPLPPPSNPMGSSPEASASPVGGLPLMPGTMPTTTSPPAPRPTAPGPGVRVSLTGEVIDSGMPSAAPPSYVGGPPAGSRPEIPSGVTRRPSTVYRPETTAPAKSGSGATVGLVAALVLVLLGGVGGWYLWMHRTNPKDQALAFYKAFLVQDYRTAYTLTAFGEEGKKKYPDADAFAKESEAALNKLAANPVGQAAVESMKSAAQTATVGDPVITGDKADVPTSMQVTIFGQKLTFHGTAHMINEGGLWKVDMTGANTQQEGARIGSELVGKPDMPAGLPGGLGKVPGR